MEDRFQQELSRRILLLDGAMGTMIQSLHLTAEDFGGEAYEGCNEVLNLTAPDKIRGIHLDYLRAGADVIETNTFGSTGLVLSEYGLREKAYEITLAGARIAREAVRLYEEETGKRAFVAGSMGPTTKAISVTGGINFDELVSEYKEQAKALLEGGVDLLLVETAQDTLNVKAAGLGIEEAFQEQGRRVPLLISGTIETTGTMLAGQTIDAFYTSIKHLQPLAVGINCATGPDEMRDHLRTLASLHPPYTLVYPNAGMPDEEGHYHEEPEAFAAKLGDFLAQGWVRIVGGCCGTTPEHIRALSRVIRSYEGKKDEPIASSPHHPHEIAGMERLEYHPTERPILVGERTNVIGSKKFRRLIEEGHFEEAAEIGRDQVDKGAQVLDICLANPDRDEQRDMEDFLHYAVRMIKAPFMIDSTDERVIELALKRIQGKSIINSVNLEDGEERVARIVPLLHRYGASLVVGLIDEKGMAVTLERKMEIARRVYSLLTQKYSVAPEDIIFDPLVFPVASGDEEYKGSAVFTLEAIQRLKEEFPRSLTILGISNISFGLPPAAREVVNSVFLYEATKRGLDYAIVNTEKLIRYASLDDEAKRLAEELLFKTDSDSISRIADRYRKKEEEKEKGEDLPLMERIRLRIVEGRKGGLLPDLDLALQELTPLEIINGPLMDGMDEVGRLFNENKLIVAEVLQSAEVMKAAVSYLEQFMEKREESQRGKVILATVKGDVHDIGKNLVEMILANNGYQVINLGIKVPSEKLIEAVHTYRPDYIGLSGLLVKSAQQMSYTVQDFQKAGISLPVLVGGAALTNKFTETKIAPFYDGPVFYAKDAMEGLSILNRLQSPEEREKLLAEKKNEPREVHSVRIKEEEESPTENLSPTNPGITHDHPLRKSPFLHAVTLFDVPLDEVIPYLNWNMLLGKHLGVHQGSPEEKRREVRRKVEEILSHPDLRKRLRLNGKYRYFPVYSKGNTVFVMDEKGKREIGQFTFPRQRKGSHLSIADFFRPYPTDQHSFDSMALFVVTCGENIREVSEGLKQEGEYFTSFTLQALALELAEAFAEKLHHRIRQEWGMEEDLTMHEILQAKYTGCRYSFGYPACPNLEDQRILFRLLQPEEIGVTLTEGDMMEPEASVSAIVTSHPKARYFAV